MDSSQIKIKEEFLISDLNELLMIPNSGGNGFVDESISTLAFSDKPANDYITAAHAQESSHNYFPTDDRQIVYNLSSDSDSSCDESVKNECRHETVLVNLSPGPSTEKANETDDRPSLQSKISVQEASAAIPRGQKYSNNLSSFQSRIIRKLKNVPTVRNCSLPHKSSRTSRVISDTDPKLSAFKPNGCHRVRPRKISSNEESGRKITGKDEATTEVRKIEHKVKVVEEEGITFDPVKEQTERDKWKVAFGNDKEQLEKRRKDWEKLKAKYNQKKRKKICNHDGNEDCDKVCILFKLQE